MPPAPDTSLTGRQLWAWLRTFQPMPITAGRHERIKSSLGALVGLFITEWISRRLLGGFNPWFIAPMGASAVLAFAVPASPLAQPWSIIGGNLVAATVGVACAMLVSEPGLAAGLAVAIAIALMFPLRCVHPPSGAVAATAVLGGPAVKALGFGFVVMPVAINSMLLVLVALAFNNLLRRRYPHRPPDAPTQHHTRDVPPSQRVGFTRADLDAVLEARGEFLDIEEDDLEAILVAAELQAFRRRFGDISCADIMSRDVVTATADMPTSDAAALLARHRIKALPVVDDHRRLLGIVTQSDFFAAQRVGSPRANGSVRTLMTHAVTVARADQPMVELARAFSDGGLHHVPVLDADRRVVGMVTQSDLVAALLRSHTNTA